MEAYIISALAAGVILCTVMAMYGFQGRVNSKCFKFRYAML
jgi:hypothetical protein